MATTAGLDRLKQAMRNAADQDEQKQPGSTSSGLARLDQAMQNAKIQDTRQQPKPLQNVRAAVEQLKTPVVTSTTGQLGSQERAQMLAQKNSQSRAAAKNSGYSQMLKTPFQTMQQQIAQSKAALAEVPDLTLVQQATRNFDDYNSRYDRDMDAFVQANARVTTLREAGVNDPEAEAALVGARNTLTDTQKQWNQVMQQTLDDLGVGTTAKIRQLIAEDEYRSRSGDKKDYEALHRELEGQLGKALLRDLTEYVRQQENAVTMDEKKQAAEDFANEHGGKASLVSIPKKIAGGVLGTADSLVQGGKRLISGSNAPMDWNAPAQTWGREAGTIRGTVSQNLNENTGNGVASFLYNTVMSMADSLAVMPLGGWGSVLLGTAAANDTMQEAVANGATDDQAMALGMIAGAAEVLTEKVSIDSLFQLEDATTVRQTLKNIVKQAIPEASEEATSSIINLLAEGVILGEQSQYEQLVQQGMERGLNRDQAAAQAFIQLAGDVGLDALGGAISGAAFATGKAGLDTALRGAGKISSRISDRAGNEPQAQNIPQVQPMEHRQTAQTALDENIFESPMYGTTLAETGTEFETNPPTPQQQNDQMQSNTTLPVTSEGTDLQHGAVGAAETGFSGEIGTWKRDAGEFIKNTEIPKQDAKGNRISDSAGSMFSANIPTDAKEMVERFAYDGEFSYTPDTNKQQVNRVHRAIEQDGFDAVYSRTVSAILDGKASADLTASAYVLLVQAANRGDSEKAAVLSKIVERNSVNTAQALQANSIYNKLSPEGRLIAIQKTVNRINNQLEDREVRKQTGRDSPKSGNVDSQTVEQVAASVRDGYETALNLIKNIYDEDKIQRDIKGALKDAGEDLSQIIRQHPGDRTAIAEGIANLLIDKYGISKDGANQAAKKIIKQFNQVVESSAKNAVQKMTEDSAISKKQEQTLTKTIRELSNMGAFLDPKASEKLTAKLFAAPVQIDAALMQEYMQATDAEEIAAVEKKIYKNIGQQIPATFKDKWNAWRYLSMLLNPTTHVSNFSGNVLGAAMRGTKNIVGTGIEAGAQKVGLIDQKQRTKALFPGKDRVSAAKADYDIMKNQVLGGIKYDPAKTEIEENRQIFTPRAANLAQTIAEKNGKSLPEWVGNISLEGLRKGNDYLLNNFEDGMFAKIAYVDALASFLRSRGISAEEFNQMSDDQKIEARSYAVREAKKATYRDINSFSKFVRDIGFRNTEGNVFKAAANQVIGGVQPFKGTPANILVRGAEYSPVGLADSLIRGTWQLTTHQITPNEYIDRISSGLTGTALLGLGMLLSNAGVLVGKFDDDDEEQNELEHHQEYAAEIGGTSVTLSQFSPAIMPIFTGVNLMQQLKKGEMDKDASKMDKIYSALLGIADPILETSMMSGLNDALESTQYADNKAIAFASNAALSYLSQSLPTVFGRLERIFGKNYRETTFAQEDDVLSKDAQRAIGKTANKIPFWDYNQIPYIDAWGRQQDVGNMGTRAFNYLINPTYTSKIEVTDVDREIRRLQEATGDNLTPSRAKNSLTIGKETILLTAEEYVNYATAKGQNDLSLRTDLIDSAFYNALDDAGKCQAMKYAEKYADILAKQEIGLKPDVPEWMGALLGKTEEELCQAFAAKAVESQAIKSADNKYDGLRQQLSNGVLEETVLQVLTEDQQEDYARYIQKANVPAETYLDALAFVSNTKSDKDKKGNTISGSRKKKIVAWINEQKLTRRQKRALFLCFYSENDDTFR